jgi:hypothetical protein
MRNAQTVFGKLLRGVLLVTLVVSFAIVTVVLIIGWAATDVLSEPATFYDLIAEVNIAERARGFLANFIISYAIESDQSNVEFLEKYQLTTWETVAAVIIPEEWLESHLNDAIASLFVWLDDPELQVPDYVVDLIPIKEVLHSPVGAMAILPLLQEFPICESDIDEIIIFGDSLITCIPKDRDTTSIAQKIAGTVAESLQDKISTTSLQQAGLVQIESIQTLLQIRAGKSIIHDGLELGLRFSILLFGLYAVFQSSSPKHLLKSLSLPLYITGGILLLLYGVLYFFLETGLELTIRNLFPYLTLEVQNLSVEILYTLGKQIGVKWMIPSLYLIVIAVSFQLLYLGWTRISARGKIETHEIPEVRQRIRKRFR